MVASESASKLGLETYYLPPCGPNQLEPLVDVVAVHGFGANPDWTWVAGNVNWLKDGHMLPHAIPNTRILRFGYESQWLGKDAIQQRLPLVADQLLHGLMLARQDCLLRPIVFIGHCFGGIVIEKAIVSAKLHEEDYPCLVRSTAGVIFLGTPHRGSNSQSKASVIASIASSLTHWEHNSLLKVLEKDSEVLADLLHDFTRTVNTISIPLFCFFEQQKSDLGRLLKFKGSKILVPTIKDAVVDERSGCLDGHPKLGLSCDHFKLNKFSSAEDSNYLLVCGEVLRLVQNAPYRVNSRRGSLPILQPSPNEISTQDYMGGVSSDASTIINEPPSNHDEKFHASIQALFVTDPSDDMHMIANKKDRLLDTTDSWIQQNSEYQQWLSDGQSLILWLHGDPGKGKTMLAIALIENFAKQKPISERSSNSALLYFFCDSQDDRRRTAPLILRGIIYQTICQHPDLAIHLYNEYEKQREQLFTSPNSLQTLWRIFHTIIEQSDLERVYIVIDALDECESESLEMFLVLLQPYLDAQNDELNQNFGEVASCHIKWLVTSRNELNIKQPLMGSLDISLEDNATHVEEAVLKFVDIKVKQLAKIKHYDEKLKATVEDHLRQKAEGTFLWVALACRELSKPSVMSVNTSEVLSQLPSGITPLYSRIMDQVLTSSDDRSAVYITAILQSMIVALRPLTLPELAVAANLPKQYHENIQILSEYVEQCGSMVTVRQRQAHFVHLSAKTYLRQAHFIHLTARNHLLDHARGRIISTDLQIENCDVALHCFAHIATERGSSGSSHHRSPSSSRLSRKHSGQSGNQKDEQGTAPMLDYPMLFWVDHAKEAPDVIAKRFDINIGFFKPESKQRKIWFDAYWKKRHHHSESAPDNFTAVHLAAFIGLPWLLSNLLYSGCRHEIYASDSLGNKPLAWAAKNGHDSVVCILLENGATPDAKNDEGVTALYWAARNGHAKILSQLVRQGASLSIQDSIGWTALHRAAFSGHTAAVHVLLDSNASIDTTDGTKWTALMRAATTGNTEVTELLLQRNASVISRDMEGCTPLHHAALNGHFSIVKLYLENGADFEARDNEQWTVLHHAAWQGHEKIVRLLLKKGADVHARAENGWTPLHQATWNGNRAVVKRLVEGGADPNKTDDEGETALHQAAWRGHAAVMKYLLQADANPNAKDRTGSTALHQAASNGSEAVAQLLLAEGADPRVEDNDSRKPHSIAEENFHHGIAKILRDQETEMYGEVVLPDTDNIPETPIPGSHVDAAIISVLSAKRENIQIKPYGQAGFSTPSKIVVTAGGKVSNYFMKTGPDGEMFKGEHESLIALHAAVPSLAPRSIAHGKLVDSDDSFLLTEFIDMEASARSPGSGLSLAQKLAKLHSTPPPTPKGFPRPVFGFHVQTCVGRNHQDNSWSRSWPKFYTENRLRPMFKLVEKNHGPDTELAKLFNRIVKEVVPALLGNGHLGGRKGVQPALVHGDLWSGNKTRGVVGGKGGIEDVVFDAGCSYAHSEYELGIMRMFGGFSAGFFNEYHRLVPKTSPKKEYDDRLALYELYQWLSHYALFSGGYREDALDCMEKLVDKYGQEEEEDEDESDESDSLSDDS